MRSVGSVPVVNSHASAVLTWRASTCWAVGERWWGFLSVAFYPRLSFCLLFLCCYYSSSLLSLFTVQQSTSFFASANRASVTETESKHFSAPSCPGVQDDIRINNFSKRRDSSKFQLFWRAQTTTNEILQIFDREDAEISRDKWRKFLGKVVLYFASMYQFCCRWDPMQSR